MSTLDQRNTESGMKKWGCLAFALTATVLSLLITGMQGWNKGGPPSWQLLWVVFGIFTVLAAHALPAVCHPKHLGMKIIMVLTWLVCVCFVASGHIGFFLSLQQVAGNQRVEAIQPEITAPSPKRTLLQIRKDQAWVQKSLNTLEITGCDDDCTQHRYRVTQLQSRARVLEAEEAEFNRWQAIQDRLQARRDDAQKDPVMARLADWVGVTDEHIGLVMGLLFTMTLEGIGCLCWLVFANQRDSKVTLKVTNPVPVSPTTANGETRRLSDLVAKVKAEIDAGRLKLGVAPIRTFLGCGQETARKVRQVISEGNT